MSLADRLELFADEVYAKAKQDELTEFNGTAMPFPDRMTEPTNIGESFEVITDEVYVKGRDNQWNENWDTFQENGNKTNYYTTGGGFQGSRWNDVSFKPKYDIVPINAHCIFYESQITDLIGILKKQGVKLDFSKATDIRYLFQWSKIKQVGVVDTRNSVLNSATIFGDNYAMHTIEKLILKEDGSQTVNFLLWGLWALENIVIEGTIGASTQAKQSSKLTRDSMIGKVATSEQIAAGKNLVNINGTYYYGGIFGALKVLDKGTTNTLNLHATALARLSEEEITIVSNTTGWTIVSG